MFEKKDSPDGIVKRLRRLERDIKDYAEKRAEINKLAQAAQREYEEARKQAKAIGVRADLLGDD